MNTTMLTGSRVLITGGAGLIGSHIAELLAAERVAEVVVLDNFVRGRRENLAQAAALLPRLTVVDADITEPAAVHRAMEGIDYVFHQAALRITQCAETPREAVDVLIGGTFNVLEAAVAAGVQKVVAASSASVYGEPSYVPMDEAHPFNNRTLYGAGKISLEQMLRSYNDMFGLPYVALRYFNVYGPRMDTHGVYTEVMIRWMQRLAAGLPPIIHGDGLQTMDFVFVSDIARANVLAMKSDVRDEALNVASGVETSLRELCRQLTLACDRDGLEPEFVPARKVNPVTRRLGGVERAAEAIGFRAATPLAIGLSKLVQWFEAEQRVAAGAAV